MNIRRVLRPSSVVCVVLGLLAFIYLRPITALCYTKWKARDSPEMWIVPGPLPDTSSEPSGGKKFSYFGYEFESPWTDVKKERKWESIVVLNFSNGTFISILDPARSANELQAMKQEAAKRGVDIKTVFGEEATHSNYALRSKIFNLTPRDLRLFSPRREMVSNSVLLILKSIQTKRIKGGLYSYQTEWLRGFQEGGPAEDKMVIIEAWDAQDREIEVWIGSEEGANRPSQAEVNRILHSLRPIPALPPA